MNKKYICLFLLVFAFSFSIVNAKLFPIKTECPLKTENLSIDSTDYDNGEIYQLQFLLSLDSEIYPEGLVTGKYGELTKKAVEKFQEKNDLEINGIVDKDTQEKLCEEYLKIECPFKEDFKKGDEDSSHQILLMQQFLFNNNDTADGVYDDITEEKVREFKIKYGLGTDGIFDEKTREFICSSMGFGESTNNVSGIDIGIRLNVDLSGVCVGNSLIKIFEYNAGDTEAPIHKVSVYVTYPNEERVAVFKGAELLGLESNQEKAYLLPLTGVKNGRVEIILDEDGLLNEENIENNTFYFDLDCPNNDYVSEEKEEEQEEPKKNVVIDSQKRNTGRFVDDYTGNRGGDDEKSDKPPVETTSNSVRGDITRPKDSYIGNWGDQDKIDAPDRGGVGTIWFVAQPCDVNKFNHSGGVVQTCYRAAPHKVAFTANRDGIIDFGDGKQVEFRHPGNGYYPVYHTYTQEGSYCPRFYPEGESGSIALTNSFAHIEEDRTGCLIVYNQYWNNPPYGGTQGEQGASIVPPCFSTGPSGKTYEGDETYCIANYLVQKDSLSSGKSEFSTGEPVSFSWYILNTDKNKDGATLDDCPLLCDLQIDGVDNYIPYCSPTGPYNFTGFSTPGKHTVRLGISGIKDQQPYDFCSWSDPLVLNVTGEALNNEGLDVIVELEEMEEKGVNGESVLSLGMMGDGLNTLNVNSLFNSDSLNVSNLNNNFNSLFSNSVFNTDSLFSNSLSNSLDSLFSSDIDFKMNNFSGLNDSLNLSSFNNLKLDLFNMSSLGNNLDSFKMNSIGNDFKFDSLNTGSWGNDFNLDSSSFSQGFNFDNSGFSNINSSGFNFSGFDIQNTGVTNFEGLNSFKSLNDFKFDF